MIEVTVGLSCACLPSVNILIEKTMATDSQRRASYYERASGRGHNRERQHRVFTWNILSSIAPTHLRSSRLRSDSGPIAPLPVPIDFDAGLAALASTDSVGHTWKIGDEEDRLVREPSEGHPSIPERATAADGRREGWIDQNVSRPHHYSADYFDHCGLGDLSRPSKVSSELVRAGRGKQWNRIWDGKNNTSP